VAQIIIEHYNSKQLPNKINTATESTDLVLCIKW